MRALFALVLCVQAYLVLSDCSSNPCSSDQTCCPTEFPGVVGCCPSPNAVCCSDGLHCCPQNTVCNLKNQTCDDKVNKIIPVVFEKREQPEIKLKAVTVKEATKVEVVYCPGGLAYCPDGNTCCLLSSGQYGCCPYPSASCCNDRLHCCPYGTRCDPTSQYCLKAGTPMAVAPKRPHTPAFPVFK